LGGKRKLLRKLIGDFHTKYVSAGAELREMIRDGRIVEARRLAHTLKGLSGTLEIAGLTEAARDVESALRDDRMEELPSLLDVFENTLSPALAAAGAFTGATRAAVSTAPADDTQLAE